MEVPEHLMRLNAAILVFTLAMLSGCRGTQQPSLAYPGSVEYQQHAAQVHDPFPGVGTGQEMLGARPRDYDAPYSETRRVQADRWLRSPWNPANWFGGWSY
ncbi:MAG: hypothetical protein MPJ50_02595 [Pirellulales bacterium]|nr:hypothetical protein [Pirellulales bacterium]